jgi:uncharacterized protein YjeT (DUF2065 family)
MRSQLVLALYLVTTLCLLVAGLTILFSPSAFRRITDRIARLDRFSTAKPDWNPGLNLQWRIMGGIVAGGALLMLWPVIRVVFFGVRHLPPAAAPGGGLGGTNLPSAWQSLPRGYLRRFGQALHAGPFLLCRIGSLLPSRFGEASGRFAFLEWYLS